MSTELTPQERFAAIERNLQMITELHLAAELKSEEWRAEWERRAARADERLAQADERAARADERAAQASEEHNRDMAAIRGELRRAVRLAIQEARAERRKRRELDDKITQLAAAQLVTEEKFQRLMDLRGGNGHTKP